MTRFCPHCDVSEDLHDGEGADACKRADAKARLLEHFGWMLP